MSLADWEPWIPICPTVGVRDATRCLSLTRKGSANMYLMDVVGYSSMLAAAVVYRLFDTCTAQEVTGKCL